MPRTYVAGSGAKIQAGRVLPVSATPYVQFPGNTVQPLANWYGRGWQKISIVPAPTAHRNPEAHGAMTWDSKRKRAWFWGMDTHGIAADVDNTPRYWDAETDTWGHMHVPSPWPGEYRRDANGQLFADAAHSKPWAAHGFNSFHLDPTTDTISVCVDPRQHCNGAGTSWTGEIQEGAPSADLGAVWTFSPQTGQWSSATGPQINSVYAVPTFPFAQVHVPGDGWYGFDGGNVLHIDAATKACTSTSAKGTFGASYQGVALYDSRRDRLVMGMGSSATYFASFTPRTNLQAGTIFAAANYPMLSGWSTSQSSAAIGPDGRYYFVALNTTSLDEAMFVLDFDTGVLTDTGYRLPCVLGTAQYDWQMVYCPEYACFLKLCFRTSSTNLELWAFRP